METATKSRINRGLAVGNLKKKKKNLALLGKMVVEISSGARSTMGKSC